MPSTEPDPALLRCPFCGGVAKLLRNYANAFGIECTGDGCEAKLGCYGPDRDGDPDYAFGSATEAAAAWNRRVPGS